MVLFQSYVSSDGPMASPIRQQPTALGRSSETKAEHGKRITWVYGLAAGGREGKREGGWGKERAEDEDVSTINTWGCASVSVSERQLRFYTFILTT